MEWAAAMKYNTSMIKRLSGLAALLSVAWACAAVASLPEVRIDGERLYLEADGHRLEEVLEGFVRAGVSVRLDPGVDARVTGTLEDVDLEEGLDNLLESFSYLLFWDVIHGPLGPMPRLSQIDIFRPGHRNEVTPFAPKGGRMQVVRDPSDPSLLYVKDELLIGFKPGMTAAQFRALLQSIGGMVVESLPELGVYRIRLPEGSNVSAVQRGIGDHPLVAAAEPNQVVTLPGSTAGQPSSAGARTLAPPDDGSASLAVFDSGLTMLPELTDAVVGQYNAVDPDREMTDPVGHGTQMALVAAGSVVPEGAPEGMFDESVPVFAVRAFNDEGQASSFGIMSAVEFAVAQDAEVINMSWGSEHDSEFMENAIRYAQGEGLIVVAAAGNEPTQVPLYPAAYDNVIAVAATEGDGALWANSNYGDFITLAAPGIGSFPIGHEGPPGGYAGTSISSAYVSQALARYIDLNPGATSSQATQALIDALTDAGAAGKDNQYGYGVLDAAAMERLLD